jgi:CxxC motif-containing protein
MPESKTLTCLGCPMGCPLQLSIENGEIREITGYECKRGEEYGRQEYTNPCRLVSTTVACSAGLWPRLPVKTVGVVPKDKVLAVARALHALKIEAPVEMGQIILDDVAGTGVAVVATRSLPRI